jgi:hypothetical protein
MAVRTAFADDSEISDVTKSRVGQADFDHADVT